MIILIIISILNFRPPFVNSMQAAKKKLSQNKKRPLSERRHKKRMTSDLLTNHFNDQKSFCKIVGFKH